MALYIGHDSAVAYWLQRSGSAPDPEYVPDRNLLLAENTAASLESARQLLDVSDERPLHTLVAERGMRRILKQTVPHVWSGPVPGGAFCSLGSFDRIASPEFTYLLMAPRRPIYEVIERGDYLCSTFSIDSLGYGFTGLRERPLTTPEDIRNSIGLQPDAYGAKAALGALEYVVPNLASPMEVFLAMEFALPAELGGFAMPHMVANQPVEVPVPLRSIAGASHFICDLYLPDYEAEFEYDSYEYHTGRARADHDAMRRNILETMGIKTISVTYGQIDTFERFKAFVWMAEERFGIPHRTYTHAEQQAQMALYDFLMRPERPRF